jgi:hypothetical protein
MARRALVGALALLAWDACSRDQLQHYHQLVRPERQGRAPGEKIVSYYSRSVTTVALAQPTYMAIGASVGTLKNDQPAKTLACDINRFEVKWRDRC